MTSPLGSLFLPAFSSPKSLQKHRISITRDQIMDFWENKSLLQKQKLLCLTDWTILSYISMHIGYFISNKKFMEAFPCFRIRSSTEYLLSIYDCIVFRVIALEKEERELISSFLLIVKETAQPITTRVHEVICNQIITGNLIKVKASYIIRIIGFMEKYLGDSYFDGQKYVLDDEHYKKALDIWISRKQYKDNIDLIRDLFLFMLILLENQIIKAFVGTLSEEEIFRRKYKQPVKIIEEPKSVSLSTSTYNFGIYQYIDWNSLKIEAFKMKYRVVKQGKKYLCFKNPDEEESCDEQRVPDNQEDRLICEAFKLAAKKTRYY